MIDNSIQLPDRKRLIIQRGQLPQGTSDPSIEEVGLLLLIIFKRIDLKAKIEYEKI